MLNWVSGQLPKRKIDLPLPPPTRFYSILLDTIVLEPLFWYMLRHEEK